MNCHLSNQQTTLPLHCQGYRLMGDQKQQNLSKTLYLFINWHSFLCIVNIEGMIVRVARVNCYHSNHMTRYCCHTSITISVLKCACQITWEKTYYLHFKTKLFVKILKKMTSRVAVAISDTILNISSCQRVVMLHPLGA